MVIEVPLTSSVILIGAIISQGCFAAVLLLLSQNNFKSNRYLGLLLLTFSLWLLDDFFNAAMIYQQNPNFYFLPIYYSLAFGPLIYLYTLSITQADFKFSKKQVWHFIPVLMQVLLYVFLQCKEYGFRRWFWEAIHLPYTYNIEFIGSLLSLIIYLFFSLQLVKQYQQWINNQYSEVSKINLNWLKVVQGVLIIICCLWLIDTILRLVWQYYPTSDFSATFMGFSILVLAGGALLQTNLKKVGFEGSTKRNHAAAITVAIDPLFLDKIKADMQENKYFLNPNLTLSVFAKKLGEPSRKISLHINQGFKKSFIDFVNEYRVQEFKKNIEDEKLTHLTLIGIAFESGFNSKSTFNRVFKKISGESPSAYQKRTQNRN